MSFERAWVLVFLALPAALAAWEWSRTASRLRSALKHLALAAVVVALAGPAVSVWETKVAVAVLADTSASITSRDLREVSELARRIWEHRGRHVVRILPFAGEARPLGTAEREPALNLRPTPGPAGRRTNIEAAVLDSITGLPAGLVPRLFLITDGRENQGSVSRAAWLARDLGIPVDTWPLAGRERPQLRIEAVRFPAIAFAGERFSVELAVRSPRDAEGSVTLRAEGKELGTRPVRLTAGLNRVAVTATLNLSGAYDIIGTLVAQGLGEVRFAQAISIRTPRVLYVSQDPPGTGEHLLGALRSGGFTVEEANGLPAGELKRYQVVILNNWDFQHMAVSLKRRLEEYVRRGGGLLVIGGERNVYLEERRRKEDPLEEALPARLAPPRSPEGTCVVLIIDKSSSMEGRKMELARLAAIGVVENLRRQDRVGVLIFDNSFQWAVPIRRAENRTLIKRLIAGITPDGGTQIAPALAEAYRRILPVKATFKHIVLLTDGISEEGDSIALAKEAAGNRVTISTVGLGQDVNRSYLEKVATFAKGRAYFLSDPSQLAQILLRDVMEHTGKTAVEKPVRPVVAARSQILAGIPDEEWPPLKGYVRFEAKPSAETVLRLDVAEKDPLLARWQYGLGRAAVFASDAKSRWAEAWVGWRGFDVFWLNVVRDLLPHAVPGRVAVSFDPADRRLTIDLRLAPGEEEPDQLPELFVFGADGFRQPLEMTKVAQGAWRGSLEIGDRTGLFRVRPLEETPLFPETGIYLEEKELADYGSDERLLKAVAAFTGGRFRPSPEEVFDAGGRAIPAEMPLWPWFLALAVLLNLAELTLRKMRALGA